MKQVLSILLLLFIAPSIFAQETNDLNQVIDSMDTISHKVRPAYLKIVFGVHHGSFRDYASSPLFYSGNPIYIAIAHTDLDAKRESSFCLSYVFGNFKSKTGKQETVSNANIIALNYLELFQLAKRSSTKINIKVGGQINATAIIRDNPALGNNADGYDLISTLFGSIKGTIDLSKKENKDKHKHLFKSLFRKSALELELHVGLMNNSYRNGFIYTRQAPLLNQDDIDDGYELRLFSGYRINSSVAYITRLNNGNAVKLSYQWDAYRTGRNQHELEVAVHLLKLALLFNLNQGL